MPLNRREVLCYNVQLGAYSELEILSRMVKKYKNAGASHLQFPVLSSGTVSGDRRYHREVHGNWISKLYTVAVSGTSCLSEKTGGLSCEIHLSGETGEVTAKC